MHKNANDEWLKKNERIENTYQSNKGRPKVSPIELIIVQLNCDSLSERDA